MTRFFNRSILNSSLRHHALLVGMLHLAHFGDGIRQLDNCRMRIPPRQDNMHHLLLFFQPLGHLGRIEHPVADRVIYFIQYDEVPLTRLNCLLRVRPSLFDHAHVFRIRLRSEEHTSELQSQSNLVCRLLLEKKKTHIRYTIESFDNNVMLVIQVDLCASKMMSTLVYVAIVSTYHHSLLLVSNRISLCVTYTA